MDRFNPSPPRRHGVGALRMLLAIAVGVAVLVAMTLRLPSRLGDDVAAPAVNDAAETAVALDRPAVDDAPAVELPRALETIDWDKYVGQRVRIPGQLVVVDTYNLASRGQVSLATQRLYIPTEIIDPNDDPADGVQYDGKSNAKAVNAVQKQNNASWITLDDGVDQPDRFPVALFPAFGTDQESLRAGSTVSDVGGVVRKVDGRTFLVVDQPLSVQPAPRPPRPDLGNANVTVASFNVLNYFSTIDDGSNQARGADSFSELERQTQKLVSAIVEMDADVIGLMELENNLDAEQRLVAAVNERLGQQVYVGCGLPEGFRNLPGGGDTIRVGLIYRRDRVEPAGTIAAIKDNAFWNGRAPLLNTFRRVGGKNTFTVVVNHFKSKGGRDARGADSDQRDGQGAYNDSRKSQARAVAEAIEGRIKSDRVLVIGDLNAYRQEDPIDLLRAEGLTDLMAKRSIDQAYSYVYFGQAGSLDHCFATPELARQVVGVATWHINSDEPRCLDYNEEFGKQVFYRPTPFRCSDHDPVLIGLRLN